MFKNENFSSFQTLIFLVVSILLCLGLLAIFPYDKTKDLYNNIYIWFFIAVMLAGLISFAWLFKYQDVRKEIFGILCAYIAGILYIFNANYSGNKLLNDHFINYYSFIKDAPSYCEAKTKNDNEQKLCVMYGYIKKEIYGDIDQNLTAYIQKAGTTDRVNNQDNAFDQFAHIIIIYFSSFIFAYFLTLFLLVFKKYDDKTPKTNVEEIELSASKNEIIKYKIHK